MYTDALQAETIRVVRRHGRLCQVIAETADGQRINLPVTAFSRHQEVSDDPMGHVTLAFHGFRVREETDDA